MSEVRSEQEQNGLPENGRPTPLPSGIKGLLGRLEEIGKVKIGGKSREHLTKSGYRLPEQYDEFIITTNQRDEKGDLVWDNKLMANLKAAFGVTKLREIDIVLLFDDPDLNFTYRLSYFGKSGLHCYGNGEVARRRVTDDEGNPTGWKELVCNPDRCEFYQQGLCKAYGKLRFIIPQAPRIGGIYTFRTTSWNSIRAIKGSLDYLRMLTGGILAMMPLKLVYRRKTVQDKNGKLRNIPVVNIEFAGNYMELAKTIQKVAEIRKLSRVDMAKLEEAAKEQFPSPEEEPLEEQREAAEEFYPEAAEEEPEADTPTAEQWEKLQELMNDKVWNEADRMLIKKRLEKGLTREQAESWIKRMEKEITHRKKEKGGEKEKAKAEQEKPQEKAEEEKPEETSKEKPEEKEEEVQEPKWLF